MKGALITFEGADGVGKSTQIKLLAPALRKKGLKVWGTREPGGTALGEKLRKIIKNEPMHARSELLLFETSRAELVEKELKPRLQKGTIILSDRYMESTLVFQGLVRGLPINEVKSANQLATGGLCSDFIVLLHGDLAWKTLNRRTLKDRFEREKNQFHRKVQLAYLRLAKKDKRFHVYSSDLPKQKIHELILKDVVRLLRLRHFSC